MDYLEKLACRFLIWRLKIGYGANCKTRDLDDFKEDGGDYPRCASCQARETIEFLEEHIKTIDY